jgi:hypothetical protein
MINSPEDVRWRKARHCGSNACVEVAKVGDLYWVRDSKHPQAAPMRFSREEWDAFVTGVRGGDFDF